MQQRGEPEHGFRRHMRQGKERMLPDVYMMIAAVLRGLHHRVEPRQDHRRNACLIKDPEIARPVRYEQLHKLVPDPLFADARKIAGADADLPQRFLLDREPKLRREADRPEDPEHVFGKPFRRFSDTAYTLLPEILLPAEKIDKAALWIPRHRVDREITPLEIFLQPVGKCDLLRMPHILIRAVEPVRGHFIRAAGKQHGDRSVRDTGIHGPAEDPFDLGRKRVRRDVVILRRPPEQHISDASADRIGFVSVLLKTPYERVHRSGKTHFHRFSVLRRLNRPFPRGRGILPSFHSRRRPPLLPVRRPSRGCSGS